MSSLIRLRSVFSWCVFAVVAGAVSGPANDVALFAQAPSSEVIVQGVDVLTRGPVHEAFAVPVGNDPVVSVVVPKQPPADIEELAPEVSTSDPNAQWIGGYWAWDDERQDFLWVSGVWRSPPPEHRWIGGYWIDAPGGYQRVSGFWSPITVQQVNYLPAPPASLEAGPSSPAPGPNYFWVPGNWVSVDARYAWQPGYWAASQEQWVWVPSNYNWTPGGYVYNVGYWDYPPQTRGMIFAPVYFQNRVYAQPGFSYSPSVLISTTQLLYSLFARPSYGSYYFGDYYDPRYMAGGYYPWYSSAQRRGWYDPFFAYNSARYGRSNPQWMNDYSRQFDYYTANRDARPRHTYEDQRRWWDQQQRDGRGPNDRGPSGRGPDGRDRDPNDRANVLAVSLSDVTANPQLISQQIRRIDPQQRQTFEQLAKDNKQFSRDHRARVESEARVAVNVPGAGNRPQPGDNRPTPGNRPGADRSQGDSRGHGKLPQLQLPDAGPAVAQAPATETPPPTAGPRQTPRTDSTKPDVANPGIAVGEPNPSAPRPNMPGRDARNPNAPNNDVPKPNAPDVNEPRTPPSAGNRPRDPRSGPMPGRPDRTNLPNVTPPSNSTIPTVTPKPDATIPTVTPPSTTPPVVAPPATNVPRTLPAPSDRGNGSRTNGGVPTGTPPGRDPRNHLPNDPRGNAVRRSDSQPPQMSRPQQRPPQTETPPQNRQIAPQLPTPKTPESRPQPNAARPPEQRPPQTHPAPQERPAFPSPKPSVERSRPQPQAQVPKIERPAPQAPVPGGDKPKKDDEKKRDEEKKPKGK